VEALREKKKEKRKKKHCVSTLADTGVNIAERKQWVMLNTWGAINCTAVEMKQLC
jgi:hypothetical protein